MARGGDTGVEGGAHAVAVAGGVQRPINRHYTGYRRRRRNLDDEGRRRAACRLCGGALRCFLGLCGFALSLGLLGRALAFQGLLVLGVLFGALLGAEFGQHLAGFSGAGRAFGVGDAALRIGAAHHLGVGRGQGEQPGAQQRGE